MDDQGEVGPGKAGILLITYRRLVPEIAVAAVIISSFATAPARAATTLPAFGDILVDDQYGRVLVTSGREGSTISVFDFDGNLERTISGEPGAGGMEIVGDKLYVLLANAATIDEFDLATLTKTNSFPIPAPDPPESLAYAGGRLWFGVGECSQSPDLASLDPITGETVNYPELRPGLYCPGLAASPAAAGTLITWDYGLSPGTLYKIDVSTDTPAVVLDNRLPDADLTDVDFSPDGTLIYVGSQSANPKSYRVSDLQKVREYPVSDGSFAIDLTHDGSKLAVGDRGIYDPDVWVFPVVDSSPSLVVDFGESGRWFGRGAIGISPDGSRVYALTREDPYSGPWTLHVIGTDAVPTDLALRTSTSRVNYRGSVTVTADLSGTQIAGEPVSIYMTPNGGARKLVKSGTIGANGELKATVRLTRKTTFDAVYEGDVERAASMSPKRVVNVRAQIAARLLAYFDTEGKYKIYHYGDLPPVRATVVPNHAGAPVKFILQIARSGTWDTIDTGTVQLEADSTANAYVIGGGSPHNYRARVVFAGDVDHLGDKTPWMYLRYR